MVTNFTCTSSVSTIASADWTQLPCLLRCFFPGQVQVHRDHVLRAWKLLQILHIMRDYWSKTEEDGAKGIVLPPASADLQSRVPEHIKCPQSQGLDHFPATQRFEPKPEIPSEDEATPTPKECLTGKAFDAAMAKGYNDAGLSVQLLASWMSDRDIFRRTVLRGKMEVTYGDLSLRKTETLDDGKKKKVAVSKDTWEQVVKAALALYPIGKLEAAGTSKSKLVFSQVPTQNAKRVAFHNMLVDSCQVSVRQWCDSLQKETDRVASRKRKQGETTEKPGDED